MGNGISLCMIVRDEEENLGRCLRSAGGCVDEIVVVDTGSRDATVEIAQRHGARVLHYPWQDDFSQARNRSLEEAAGEWILVLDADEELPPEAARLLNQLAGKEDVEAWTFTIVSPHGPGEDMGATRHAALRLFRNREEHRFEGIVHEQVQPGILRRNPAAGVRHANLEIRHQGYTTVSREAGQKTARNIRLLEKALAADPFDPFQNYNLGVSYLVAGEPEKARSRFDIALLAADGRSGFSPALYRNYALCLDELGDYTACLKLLDEGLGHFPAYPDLHFLKGRLFFQLGLLNPARACFLTCTGFRHVPPEYTTMEGVTSYLSQEKLAEVALREGDQDLAVQYLAAVCRSRGSYGALRRLALVLQQKGLPGLELAQGLTGHLDIDQPTLARLLFDLGEYGACLAHLPEAPDQPSLLLHARCLTRTGQPAAALALLNGLSGTAVNPVELAREKWLAGWLQGPVPAGPPPEAQDKEVAALMAEVAYAAWLRGEAGAALSLAGVPAGDAARLLLAGLALAKGRPAVAGHLLEEEPPGAECSFLKGRVSSELGRHREAFLHFLQAARTGEKTCYLQALEQAISHCRSLVLQLLEVEGPNSVLQLELFRLASRQKKLARYKGELRGEGC